jgi:hypothetical protein
MIFSNVFAWFVTGVILLVILRLVMVIARFIGVFQGRGNIEFSYDRKNGKVRQHRMKL